MIKSIIKRDGRVVLYDEGKIASAILKAMEAAQEGDASQAAAVANAVEAALEERCGAQHAPNRADSGRSGKPADADGLRQRRQSNIFSTAPSRTRVREMNTRLMKVFDELTHADATASDMKRRQRQHRRRHAPWAPCFRYGSEGSQGTITTTYLLTPEQARAHREGDIHIHDFDFYALTTTCCQIDLLKLFKGGFSTGPRLSARAQRHCRAMRPWHASPSSPTRTTSTAARASPNFDYGLAPGRWPKPTASSMPSKLRKSARAAGSRGGQ